MVRERRCGLGAGVALPGHPDFWGKLERARRERGTLLGLSLAVRSDRMPAPMLRVDDPIFPFGKAMRRAVGDGLCACAFPLMAFLAEGAAGMVAMERLMRFAPDPLPLLLDARWRDPCFSGPGAAPPTPEPAP